jgi:hypothetical protein
LRTSQLICIAPDACARAGALGMTASPASTVAHRSVKTFEQIRIIDNVASPSAAIR